MLLLFYYLLFWAKGEMGGEKRGMRGFSMSPSFLGNEILSFLLHCSYTCFRIRDNKVVGEGRDVGEI